MSQPLRPFANIPRHMLAGIRLIATDIDGTMTRDGKLGADVLTAILQLAEVGVAVLPVTGRPAGEALGLARYLPCVYEAIAENGAVLVRPDQDVIHLWNPPDRALLTRIAGEIAAPESPLTLAEDAFCRVGDVAFLRDGREDAEIAALAERGLARDVFVIWSSVHIHFSLHAPDKGAAVLTVSQERGVQPEQILTIGDAPNDIGLWVPGRFGVTVGTADVHKHADALPHKPAWVCDGVGAEAWLTMARRVHDAVSQATRK